MFVCVRIDQPAGSGRELASCILCTITLHTHPESRARVSPLVFITFDSEAASECHFFFVCYTRFN